MQKRNIHSKRFKPQQVMSYLFHLILIWFTFSSFTFASNSGDPIERITVFLDCAFCNENQVKKELNYLNFAIDPLRSNVHVFLTRQSLPSGSNKYRVEVIGQEAWAGEKISFDFLSDPQATNLQQDELIIKKIAIGLAPFIAKTTLAEDMELTIHKENKPVNTPISVPNFWNNFIYDLGFNMSFNGDANQSTLKLGSTIELNNVSPEWRTRINSSLNYQEKNISTSDKEILAIQRNQNTSLGVVKSIDDHFSMGLFNSYYANTFTNIDFSFWFAPAVEYNIFPYDDVPIREFTIAYRLGYMKRKYAEETIYSVLEEQLYRQMLDINFRMRRPWGNVFAGISGSNFMDDWSKNRFVFNGSLSVRVLKGLQIRLGGNYQIINDQISLPKGEASVEDLLLAQRQAATNFQASMNIGMNYTFGALYNNVVNTRL